MDAASNFRDATKVYTFTCTGIIGKKEELAYPYVAIYNVIIKSRP